LLRLCGAATTTECDYQCRQKPRAKQVHAILLCHAGLPLFPLSIGAFLKAVFSQLLSRRPGRRGGTGDSFQFDKLLLDRRPLVGVKNRLEIRSCEPRDAGVRLALEVVGNRGGR
jgi:hypothetical protein